MPCRAGRILFPLKKVEYINALLNVGFDTIDFGSFVSPKQSPNGRHKEVIGNLQLKSRSKLLPHCKSKGAEDAVVYDEISYLFSFSVSKHFKAKYQFIHCQSLAGVGEIQNLCIKNKKSWWSIFPWVL
jgi:hydroxymethylglutaryl-CoA lyase